MKYQERLELLNELEDLFDQGILQRDESPEADGRADEAWNEIKHLFK